MPMAAKPQKEESAGSCEAVPGHTYTHGCSLGTYGCSLGALRSQPRLYGVAALIA